MEPKNISMVEIEGRVCDAVTKEPITGIHTDAKGNVYRFKDGVLHDEYEPAAVWANGDCAYYQNGVLHREFGPALIRHNNQKLYFENGNFIKVEG